VGRFARPAAPDPPRDVAVIEMIGAMRLFDEGWSKLRVTIFAIGEGEQP
jgi:hypothetical protein